MRLSYAMRPVWKKWRVIFSKTLIWMDCCAAKQNSTVMDCWNIFSCNKLVIFFILCQLIYFEKNSFICFKAFLALYTQGIILHSVTHKPRQWCLYPQWHMTWLYLQWYMIWVGNNLWVFRAMWIAMHKTKK